MIDLYFLRIMKVAPFVWAILTIGVIATSLLYAILIVLGISENASLLTAFIALTAILLALLLIPKSFFKSKEHRNASSLNISLIREISQEHRIDSHAELTEQLIRNIELLTQSLNNIQTSSDIQHPSITRQERVFQQLLQQLVADNHNILSAQTEALQQIASEQHENLRLYNELIKYQRDLVAAIRDEHMEQAAFVRLATDSLRNVVQEIAQTSIELKSMNVQINDLVRRVAHLKKDPA